ncbi:hypothetical protein [Thermaurantiacus tibetensis]|uniref:hypothetical protein n=1 Tax=Thermaurantiacus tibetensis TaxID=2759035 RepID=UPI00188F1A49|nr:hypothetical protein [Thermaurantiacus tibetensis]
MTERGLGRAARATAKAAAGAAAEVAAAVLAERIVTILARASRWRGGMPWVAGQQRTLPLADLSPAQLAAFEADPDFAVIPEQGPQMTQ